MSRKSSAVALLAASALLAGSYWAASEETAKPAGKTANPFAGKVLTISSKANVEMGSILESVEIKQLGDQYFLVGKGAAYGGAENWQAGKTVWYAVSDIAQLTEFDNMDDFRKTGRDRER